MPFSVSQRESVTRFLRKRDFSAASMRPKRQALEPMWNTDDDVWETSVYRISKRDPAEVAALAAEHVEPFRGEMKARADFTVREIMGLSLDVLPAQPPIRHAIIVGWGQNEEDHMQGAQELINIAKVSLLP